jgi:hypothetical protein
MLKPMMRGSPPLSCRLLDGTCDTHKWPAGKSGGSSVNKVSPTRAVVVVAISFVGNRGLIKARAERTAAKTTVFMISNN